MDKKTSAALEASIVHWQENYDDPENASSKGVDCALCDEFNYRHGSEGCKGCPVQKKSGSNQCFDTPWSGANSVILGVFHGDQTADEAKPAIKAELDFLISLREE